MNITKDEARILAAAIDIFKYEKHSVNVYDKLENLQNKLEKFGKDNRRRGRTSFDDFTDCLKRFAGTES